MIDTQTRKLIYDITNAFWNEHVANEAFCEITQGKEIGHHIADYVDDRTTAKLKTESCINAKHETNVKGETIVRSMGDIWIKSNGIYNPVNIKTGICSSGQPNIVSLTKLLDRLLRHQIDSYDLLIIKFTLTDKQADFNVYFVDLLDYLDFITFDMGPGQVMLRENDFYNACDSNYEPPVLTLSQKIGKCMDIMEQGYQSLIRNRATRMNRLRRQIDLFAQSNDFTVTQTDIYFNG